MTPEQAIQVRDLVVALVAQEAPATRRIIAAIPEDRLGWRPHEKGTTARDLAWHIVESEILPCQAYLHGFFAGLRPAERAPDAVAEIVGHHERHSRAMGAFVPGVYGPSADERARPG